MTLEQLIISAKAALEEKGNIEVVTSEGAEITMAECYFNGNEPVFMLYAAKRK